MSHELNTNTAKIDESASPAIAMSRLPLKRSCYSDYAAIPDEPEDDGSVSSKASTEPLKRIPKLPSIDVDCGYTRSRSEDSNGDHVISLDPEDNSM